MDDNEIDYRELDSKAWDGFLRRTIERAAVVWVAGVWLYSFVCMAYSHPNPHWLLSLLFAVPGDIAIAAICLNAYRTVADYNYCRSREHYAVQTELWWRQAKQ